MDRERTFRAGIRRYLIAEVADGQVGNFQASAIRYIGEVRQIQAEFEYGNVEIGMEEALERLDGNTGKSFCHKICSESQMSAVEEQLYRYIGYPYLQP